MCSLVPCDLLETDCTTYFKDIAFIETLCMRPVPNYNTHLKSGICNPDTMRCTAWCSLAPPPSWAPASGASRARCSWSLPAVPQSRCRRTTPWRRTSIHQRQKRGFHAAAHEFRMELRGNERCIGQLTSGFIGQWNQQKRWWNVNLNFQNWIWWGNRVIPTKAKHIFSVFHTCCLW